jgi:adenylate kinase family enzyme
VGISGAGKTTLARQLAARLGLPHVELDALHWEPGWQPADPEVFRQRVAAALQGNTWVVDGNYRRVRDLVWSRATLLLWLDYPRPLIFWRLLGRTLRRTVRREELWQGNRERFREQFLSRDSLFLWAWQTYYRLHREYPLLLQQPAYRHLQVQRFHSPRQTARWVAARYRGAGEGDMVRRPATLARVAPPEGDP